MISETTLQFILDHEGDDPARLLLSREKRPDVDMNLAAGTVEARRRLRDKVPSWSGAGIICPLTLSAEQCSGEAAARWKAVRIAELWNELQGRQGGEASLQDSPEQGPEASAKARRKPRIADLTGGLGVDSWAFSEVAEKVLHNDMNPALMEAAEHNFKALGKHNIVVSSVEIQKDNIFEILTGFKADIAFLDPARRDSRGGKVFLPKDCSPDITGMMDEIFRAVRIVFVKLSPMMDIAALREAFGGRCRRIEAVAFRGDCRELLMTLDRDWSGETEIVATELSFSPAGQDAPKEDGTGTQAEDSNAPRRNCAGSQAKASATTRRECASPRAKVSGASFAFTRSEEAEAIPSFAKEDDLRPGTLLFEPGKALMKAGAFRLLSKRFGMQKLGTGVHLYLLPDDMEAKSQNTSGNGGEARSTSTLDKLGKVYKIEEVANFSSSAVRDFATKYPGADVSARNLPIDSDQLARQMRKRFRTGGKSRGPDDSAAKAGQSPLHIFALGCGRFRILAAARRMEPLPEQPQSEAGLKPRKNQE